MLKKLALCVLAVSSIALAADKAARYEREHRARMSAERRRRKRLGRWLRKRRNDAEVAARHQQQETDG